MGPSPHEHYTVDLAKTWREKGLQVIVKLASIELTPDNPEYEGGNWHIEGMLNEHIAATSIFYYDVENTTKSCISFLQEAHLDDMSMNYEQDEHLYGLTDEEVRMIRRGATLDMIHIFEMRYDHEEGLIAIVDSVHEMYLGWNIRLSGDDPTGENLIAHYTEEIRHKPERWTYNGTDDEWIAKKLVREDLVEDYATTDTEVYMYDDNDQDDPWL